MPERVLEKAQINKMFVEISSHRATLLDCLSCFVGIKSINVSLWFVGVTAFQYVAFGLAKSIFSLREQRILVLQFYALLLALFGFATYLLAFPAHYWHNLWVLVVGLAVALYEKELLAKGLICKIFLWVGVNIFAFVYITLTRSAGILYMGAVNVGFFIMCGVESLFSHRTLKKGSAIAWLGSLSYFVYLVHYYLFPIEWCIVGYLSIILTVSACVLVAWLFSQTYNFLQRCCGNMK